MKLGSLRLRLVAGGIIAILLALIDCRHSALCCCSSVTLLARMADDLDVQLKQLIAIIDIDQEQNLVVTRPPADPRFADPLSGLYWQVADDHGQLLRSRSLWDTTLQLPTDELSPGQVHHHEALGPANTHVLIAERRISLTIGDRRVPVRVAVASDLARVSAAASAFGKELALALTLLGLVLAIATIGLRFALACALSRQCVAVLRIFDPGGAITCRPRSRLRSEPLVEEVNALLDGQEREIERSRGRAADLAHGLKTPLAALAADAAHLRERGEQVIAQEIEAVGDAMSRHVDRELARVRVRGAVRHRREPFHHAGAARALPYRDAIAHSIRYARDL